MSTDLTGLEWGDLPQRPWSQHESCSMCVFEGESKRERERERERETPQHTTVIVTEPADPKRQQRSTHIHAHTHIQYTLLPLCQEGLCLFSDIICVHWWDGVKNMA